VGCQVHPCKSALSAINAPPTAPTHPTTSRALVAAKRTVGPIRAQLDAAARLGVDASLLDAIAVLIAMVALGPLPVGPTVGAAAAVLILGRDGVAAVAAAGVLTTVTGTIGGLAFAAWAGADRVWVGRRPARASTEYGLSQSRPCGQHAGRGPTAAESAPGALEATGPRRTASPRGRPAIASCASSCAAEHERVRWTDKAR
jgi:hypothetical protein